ncbi:VanW family protein [Luedemannella helvata]
MSLPIVGDQPTVTMRVIDEPTRVVPAVAPPAPPAGRKRRRILGMPRPVFAGVAALAGLAVAAGVLTAVDVKDQVPLHTRVLGIDIGGRSTKDAAMALAAGLGDRVQSPVTVRVGDRTTTVDPQQVNLALDAEATAAEAAKAGPNPIKLLTGRDVEPVVSVDATKLAGAVAGTVKKAGHAMTLPKITYSGLTPRATYPVAGQGLDQDGAAAALSAGWLRQAEISLPLTDVYPKTTADEVDALLADLARPAVAAPVTVTTNDGAFTVSRQAIARSLEFTPDKTGKITPTVSESKLRAALGDVLAEVEVEPQDATVRLSDGTVRIVASQGGRLIDTKRLATDLLGVLGRSSGRTVAAAVTEVAAKTTASDLAALGIKEKVSTFTTHFSGGEGRNHNIIQVAKEVDGAVLKPGETFSLNGYTGERSYAQGYIDAPVILDGKLVKAVGGGISQFTTTLFNAAYYAGLEDVFHKPHSYYISRYPSVIESTIYYPTLDMKFRNNTPYGVLIDTTTTSDSVTVTMWSTKVNDSVTTEWGPRLGVTQPRTVHLKGDGCVPTTGGIGFAQDAWRVIKRGGEVVSREKFSWKYDAEPHFICD